MDSDFTTRMGGIQEISFDTKSTKSSKKTTLFASFVLLAVKTMGRLDCA